MMRKRPTAERGHGRHGWLDTRHSFSFGEYNDPNHAGFRSLRVLNEDRVAPGAGFATHAHRDMEIVTYVLSGALEHRDSTGIGSVLHPGQVQRMTAGSGIAHSEMNHSRTEPVHFLQIWILPEATGLKPDYEERLFPRDQLRDQLRLIASRQGLDGSLTIHRDVRIYACVLSSAVRVALALEPGRHAWVQLAAGSVTAQAHDRVKLAAGDGLAVSDVTELTLAANKESEMLVFDLD
jgi:redox-sensitive bicupin YhaK (pirin superfamily)